MPQFTAAEIIAGIVALGSLIVSLVNASKGRSERRKNESDAAESVAEAGASLIEPYRTEVKSLRDEVATMRKTIDLLGTELSHVKQELAIYKAGTRVLIGQMTSEGIPLLWTPPDYIG